MRRWRCPQHDDPQWADPARNNDFDYHDDLRGFKCPAGAHARRANPRDALDQEGSVNVRLHRMIRRGTSYGPMLPEGVLEDDGVDRGIIFVFVGAHLKRQFEFVKTQWINEGTFFIGAPAEKDRWPGRRRIRHVHHPLQPIRRRLQGLPPSSSPAAGSTLCAWPASAALAGGAGKPKQGSDPGRDDQVATSPTRTDRWKALDFGPPRSGAAEPDSPVLVEYGSGGQVAHITLNRPHADNAITTEMGARLTEILETIAVRPAVRVAIIKGAVDRAFSVGSDLLSEGHDQEDWLRQRQDFDRTLYTLRQLRKPIFRRVNGSPTAAAARSPRAPTSSSRPTTPPSASPRR